MNVGIQLFTNAHAEISQYWRAAACKEVHMYNVYIGGTGCKPDPWVFSKEKSNSANLSRVKPF